MDLQLTGKVAVVTGGSVGIGLAIARGLAAEGTDLVLCARDADRLAAVAGQIGQDFGVRVEHVAADMATILDAPDERWQMYWELHVMAAVRLARALAPGMKARGGGVILHNASICATQPLGYEPIYNVTKAALVMFSKCLANELIGAGIRVNAVNPGLVMTPDWQKTAKLLTAGTDTSWEDYLQKIADDNAPIGRFAEPDEIANLFVFLCSPRASYMVGSTYYIDGGWLNVTT